MKSLRFWWWLMVRHVTHRHPDDWLTDPCMHDRRTGEMLTRWEMFDRMAILLAICLEFGV